MKKTIQATMSLLVLLIFTNTNQLAAPSCLTYMTRMTYTCLALGDSYTIGESVSLQESFPYQTVQLLRNDSLDFAAPEIIAKTGWTTDELQAAINGQRFLSSYDFVTLLIGVNNQYRGRTVENYKPEFESLLKLAIRFAGNNAGHVAVLSVPDWGVTPFAGDRDKKQIAKEIDDYNAAAKKIAQQYKVHYLDITSCTREALTDPSLVAGDGLHPSAKEYKRWAVKLSDMIKSALR